ncbi:ABC transporter permease [Kitasatospora sp. McL0602]|uniref:ABC transporter permease n=1 Tax=Kitasatospora sp. McL0602 TaxID=3439530 RepID=UPI003F8CD064
MNRLRFFLVSGWLAYRGGFRVLTPAVFIPMVLVQPVVELLFYLQLGHYAGTRSAAFYVVGNSLYSCSVGGLFTMAVSVAVERRNNTLVVVLASPVNRLLLFASRAVPAFCIGLCTGVTTLLVGWLVAGSEIEPGRLPLLIAALLCACASATAFGLLIGAVGLRARDVNFVAGLVLSLCLLLSGANVPVSEFPAPLQALATLMPMTLSIEAARRSLDGQAGGGLLLAGQLLLAAGYLVIAAVLIRVFERSAKAHGSLEIS